MIASAMSRRSLRPAGGLRQPSESRAFLASRHVRFEPRPLDFRERDLPNATAYGGSEGIYNNLRNPRNDAIRLAPASPYSFGVALRSKDI
ncbi:hypothetical protein THAOC_10261 [Thalassiosira oceanica]|uniref:Uncharacterized protein n=1 Tax=Thalassiosira oceanica TaxID=159749 RepID=K0T5E7_THAOC|nr:hypothetical protein THAOC_10261 [Thalassiosira oceanica]|eukprot:EJK68546.1 hypothetical protein THAOC_10261 [Thalassiosira oceanica]